METDRICHRFADDNRRRGQSLCRQNEAARRDEPPSDPDRTEQQEPGQVSPKPADMLTAAANWQCAWKRYQQSQAAIRNEPVE